jgi:hypothetical protein
MARQPDANSASPVSPSAQLLSGMTPSAVRRALYAATLVAFILGVVVRADSLDASLWLDEFGTFWVVDGGFMSMLRRCWDFQGQSPLYYALPWLSIQMFGESEIALRIPSMALTCLTVGILYLCARSVFGLKAGWYAAALFWLSMPAAQYSVSARPYALVLFTVAIAIAGFLWAVRSGDLRGRVVWIVGGATVAWAHYVHYPIVVGLFVAYGLFPPLRLRYPVRQFVIDALAQMALVSLCLPQILALFARRDTLSWLDQWNHTVILHPVIELSVGLLVGCIQLWVRRDISSVERALQGTLLICLLVQVAALEAAGLAGMNLLSPRYFVSIVIPGVLFVSVTVIRARAVEVRAAVLASFLAVIGALFMASKTATGSFTGSTFQDWRGAIAELSTRIRDEPEPLVLYRSGFVEEDVMPLGHPPPVDSAPLRSPGRPAFPIDVVPLNFRWTHPHRDAYFEQRIAPRVQPKSRFYAIGNGSYMDACVEWVESHWPGRYRLRRADYGDVQLLQFEAR